MIRGRFITLEGMDGAGKTTHLAWLRDRLLAKGVALTVTREPGGTELGESLRGLLLDSHLLTPPMPTRLAAAGWTGHGLPNWNVGSRVIFSRT
jgi:thymidylate kinase